MTSTAAAIVSPTRARRGMWLLLACLLVVFGFLFASSFRSEQALFANDGPLGAQACAIYKMPGAWLGIWSDQYWIGGNSETYNPNFTAFLLWLLGPIKFNKFYVPIAMITLGLTAGYFFKRLGFHPAICILGGIAASLNSNFFSNACWGLSSRALSLAAIFLALAALHTGLSARTWGIKWFSLNILAGLAVGLSISEGGDNGAIFSIFVGIFALYQYVFRERPSAKSVLIGTGRVVIMIIFAALLAAQSMKAFINIAEQGIVGIETTQMTKEQKWSWATQWSLPKAETLRVIVPGLFGYRLDTEGGGNYWGAVGRDLAYDQTHQGLARHSGAGEYAGVLVVLVAFWSLFNASRKQDSAFTSLEKKMIWFWGASAAVSVVLSWGYHAPLYQFIYKLPFFSSIRNPMKFMHPFHLCLLILFGYGLQGIWRRYLEPAPGKALDFEKRWMIVSLAAVGLSLFALIVYASNSNALVQHLMNVGFNDPSFAQQMVKFSVNEVKLSLFILALSVVGLLLIQRGLFSGPKAKWAGVFLGILLLVDLARANAPWIKYYNYKEKYASNPVLDTLATKPWEGRAAMALSMGVLPSEFEALQKTYAFTRAWMVMQQIYGSEWIQHQFPFFNIQSLDMPQEPRMPAEKKAFRDALNGRLTRLYELTNTRFLLGMGGNFAEALNQIFDPQKRRFRLHTPFEFVQTGPETFGVQPNPSGQFGLIEFTGALPRVQLYSNWEINTNSAATLARLADPTFDPTRNVIVSQPIPAPGAAATNGSALTAEITNYSPKRIEVKTSTPGPALLLMNNLFAAGWIVTVDGQSSPLLRCNFHMQGVAIPANAKSVVFRFAPPSNILFMVSLPTIILGIGLCGFLAAAREKSPAVPPSPSPQPSSPQPSPASPTKGSKPKSGSRKS